MNVSSILTKDYENVPLRRRGKNKANSKPNKANLQNAQMNVNKVLTKDYENVRLHRRGENKPNQTQFPQITTISLFTAVNLRKEFRRFWFRYRTLLLFYAIHFTQDAQKKLCGYYQFSYGNSTILCRFRANYACIDRNSPFAEQNFWTKADLFGKLL